MKKAFSLSDVLTTHKRYHKGKKAFKCDQSDKAFRQSGELTRRKRSHTGKKSFKCCMCDKAFYRSDVLSTHKRYHTGANVGLLRDMGVRRWGGAEWRWVVREEESHPFSPPSLLLASSAFLFPSPLHHLSTSSPTPRSVFARLISKIRAGSTFHLNSGLLDVSE